AFLAPLPPPHVREPAPPTGRVTAYVQRQLGARLDSTKRGHVRQVAAGQQGSRESPRREEWEQSGGKKTTGSPAVTEAPVNNGAPPRTRTADPHDERIAVESPAVKTRPGSTPASFSGVNSDTFHRQRSPLI